ncbi:terpenoid synthase [Annulohypoxylon maeteangense]|uniref:terpenoid synthase n=1 Tax=Annulohypoxylon maeteangense TaxID=1927788 RepID=UPI0020084BD0|nr:terpenoid synthase [Annulohypoxylon maeteangense]KAI0880518.1 terpenoid synthase [Annulohypoxylon maeteangense]
MFESEGVTALRGLRGKLLQVPDLRPIYQNWASGLNPQCEELRAFVDEKIDIYVKNEKARVKTRAIDLGWFTSLCYPSAEIEQLKTMALMSMVFFIFDDTIDKEIDDETPDFASDFDAATKLRQDSVAYMRYKLFLGSNKPIPDAQPLHAPQEFASFEEFAPRVVAACPGQVDLDKLANDIQEFIDTNALEQTYRLSGSLPSTEEYWTYRHGVGAVFPYCTLHQYVNNISLPDGLAWCEEVRVLRLETSFQPLLCNDLYSLKKEMKEDTPTNLVPIMVAETGRSLDVIVHELVEQMYSSARKFDIAAASLREKGLDYDENVQRNIEMFIRAFETFQTGCFKFFMDSKRFGVKEYKQKDGSYVIPL